MNYVALDKSKAGFLARDVFVLLDISRFRILSREFRFPLSGLPHYDYELSKEWIGLHKECFHYYV